MEKKENMLMNTKRTIIAASGLICLLLAFSATPCPAGDAVEPGRAALDKLLKAVEANDYDSFVADSNEAFKASLTKQMFQGVSGQLSPRLKKGYTSSYLGELRQQGSRVLLWKLAYKDGGDDALAKLVLKDGKEAGFWLQ
jgi:hypothetical protein